MSSESPRNVLPTVALCIGVLAALTTILGYLGWHPHWGHASPSAEPEIDRAVPEERPFKFQRRAPGADHEKRKQPGDDKPR